MAPVFQLFCNILFSISALCFGRSILAFGYLTDKEDIVVKQVGALHRPVVVRSLIHGIYHLDYSPIYLDFFVRHVCPKLDNSHDAVGEMRAV